MKKVIFIITALALMAITLPACAAEGVSQEEYEELRQQIDAIEAKFDPLEAELSEELRQQIDIVVAEFGPLEAELSEELRQQIDIVVAEFGPLEAELSEIREELEDVHTQVAEEPMTRGKLVGTGFLGSAVGVYWETGFTFTNPDCVSEITIERISIIKSDGTVIYEGELLRFSWDEESGKFVGTPWLEPMKPHEARSIELDQYMQEPPPESLPPDTYTVEIFWTKSHWRGLPLIGSSSTVVLEVDGVKITGITGWYANEMVNMEQELTPEKVK